MKKRRFRRDASLLGIAGRLIGAGVAVCLALAASQANAQGAPDLVVQGTAVTDRTLAPGQSFNFRAAVFNDGEGGAGRDQTMLLRLRRPYFDASEPTLPRDAFSSAHLPSWHL